MPAQLVNVNKCHPAWPWQGNPCCEEADYCLTTIHHLPQLHVLDQHVISRRERAHAEHAVGGNVAALTVAFGKRAPLLPPRVPQRERSALERDLAQVTPAPLLAAPPCCCRKRCSCVQHVFHVCIELSA
jgi:hypothetical protein